MSQNEGALPIFLADLGVAVQDGIEVYGKDNIHPGDVFLVNHPEICGQHLNNMAVYTPFFWESELLCFLAVRAHWIDVGGGSTGFGSSMSRDVYEEGLQIRSVKIYAAGKPNLEVLRLIEDNIRFPESSFGDLRAQIACCRTGEQRLEQLCRKYGGARFQEAVLDIWDQTDRLVRAAVRAIPDGTYEAASFLDDDGRDFRKTVPIKVRVEVRAEELTIDYSDISAQVAGFINCGSSGGMAAARVAFKALTSPEREVNEGSFRALEVILPPEKLLTPNSRRRSAARVYRYQRCLIRFCARSRRCCRSVSPRLTKATWAATLFSAPILRPGADTSAKISSAAARAAGPSKTAHPLRYPCARGM